MQRKFVFSEGEFYHIYNRGVEKINIFKDEKDRSRFVRLLYVANGERPFIFRDIENKIFSEIDRGKPIVAIGAYVLMPNHFHILLKEIVEGGISMFMEKLLTGYSSYFNKRNERTGALFQGTYQAKHADSDEYLKYLFAYIHLNPVKLIESEWKEKGIKNNTAARQFLEKYKHSSFLDFRQIIREENAILSIKEFPDYFSKNKEFSDFIEDWLKYQDEYSE